MTLLGTINKFEDLNVHVLCVLATATFVPARDSEKANHHTAKLLTCSAVPCAMCVA